jgi:DNA primase
MVPFLAAPDIRQAGLVDTRGCDAYTHRIVFPLEGNLYGRSILDSMTPHRFLPAGKGGLYAWEQVRRAPEIILVEGLFDYAVLWQAGFHNVTCSLGNHLNAYSDDVNNRFRSDVNKDRSAATLAFA